MEKRARFKPFEDLMADKISAINLKVSGGRKYKFENPLRITASINGIETMVKIFLSEEEAYEYVC